MSFKLKHELEQLPDRIESLEQELESLQNQANEPDFFSRPYEQTAPTLERLAECREQLDTLLMRWEELERLQHTS